MEPDDGLVAAEEQLAAAVERADRLAAAESKSEIEVASSAGLVSKSEMAARRTTLEAARREVQLAQKAVSAAIDAQIDTLRARQAAARQDLAPLLDQVARLTEGIEALNLYVGPDESLTTICRGEPADAGEPLVIRQTVLSMAEESLVLVEDGGMDFRDIEGFDRWLASDFAHVEKVCPEPRSVVACVARHDDVDYGEPWLSAAMNDKNAQTHLLIRNGERLSRTTIAGFKAGRRLVPAADEFTSMMPDGVEPGSKRWLDAEQTAEARQRHFMKIGLILQGLIDRTEVFAPMPKRSVLSIDDYDAGLVRVVMDDSAALGDGRPKFREWCLQVNKNTTAGVRIIGDFAGDAFRYCNTLDEADAFNRHSRLSPNTAGHPAGDTAHTVEQRDGKLFFRYDRTDTRWGYEHGDWGEWGEWPYKKRASCKIRVEDRFWLCVDYVDLDDVDYYLNARQHRDDYLTMIPLLRRVKTFLQREQEEEAPFRALLEDRLPDDADVDDLILWWKQRRRQHRALLSDDSKAFREIIAEGTARAKVTAVDVDVDHYRGEHRDAVLIGYDREHKVVVAVDAGDGRHVHEFRYGQRGGNRELRWQMPGNRYDQITAVWTGERWESWPTQLLPHMVLSGPRLAECVDQIRDMHERPIAWIETVPASLPTERDRILVWSHDERVIVDNTSHLHGDHNPLGVICHEYTWSKHWDDLTLTAPGTYSDMRHRFVERLWPWQRSDTQHQHHLARGVELFRDTDVIAQIADDEAIWKTHAERRDDLRQQGFRWVRSVEAGWVETELERLRARFVEDFGPDPELWAEQTPTVRLSQHSKERLHRLANRVVDAGHVIDDLTVDAAAALVRVDPPTLS